MDVGGKVEIGSAGNSETPNSDEWAMAKVKSVARCGYNFIHFF